MDFFLFKYNCILDFYEMLFWDLLGGYIVENILQLGWYLSFGELLLLIDLFELILLLSLDKEQGERLNVLSISLV